jgi:hypothetical protein
VRTTKTAGPFTKGYKPTHTEEIFTVKEQLRTDPPRYSLNDYLDETIAGTFYEQELIRVTLPTEYKVEQILKKKTVRGVKWVLVKWWGYPSSHNSWEKEANVRKL